LGAAGLEVAFATRAFPVTVAAIAGVVAVDRVMLVADVTTMFAFWTRAAAIRIQKCGS
jgi:hypothetical protein